MLFIFISKYSISPQSVLPKLSAEVSEKCPRGRKSPLNASSQHLYLLLIIFNTSENARVKKHLADNVFFAKIINYPAPLPSKIQILNTSSMGTFPRFCLVDFTTENKIGSAGVCSQNILSFIDLQSSDLLFTSSASMLD